MPLIVIGDFCVIYASLLGERICAVTTAVCATGLLTELFSDDRARACKRTSPKDSPTTSSKAERLTKTVQTKRLFATPFDVLLISISTSYSLNH
jgi:hypothetical protein